MTVPTTTTTSTVPPTPSKKTMIVSQTTSDELFTTGTATAIYTGPTTSESEFTSTTEVVTVSTMETTCLVINTSFKYPQECNKKELLRRFFTCGITFQTNLELQKPECQCYYNYKKCFEDARKELQCHSTDQTKDPLVITVNILSELMINIYNVKCMPSMSPLNFEECNQALALKKIMMCCVTYFSLSDEHTRSVWSGSGDICSYAQDVQRCIAIAEHKTKCVNHKIFDHAREFVRHATSDKRHLCRLNVSSMSIQALAPHMKSKCRHSAVMKRALTCALQFQNTLDGYVKNKPPMTLACGYVTRLQKCLTSSVEGTECVGDSSVNAQIRGYKRVLQDAYSLNCEAPSGSSPNRAEQVHRRGESRISRNKMASARMGKHLKQNVLRRYLNQNTHMSKQTGGRGSYDEDDDYELISKRQKPVFMSPAGKLMEEPDGFRDDDSYDLLRSEGYQYHDLNRKNQRELEDYEDFADLEPDARPRTGRRHHRRHRKLRGRGGRTKKLVSDQLAAGKARHSKRDKRRKLAYEDEYFFDNEPDEESVISGLPDNMAMFQHIKHRPELNVERLLNKNISTDSSVATNVAGQKVSECNSADLQSEVNKCNVTLTKLVSLWPQTLTKQGDLATSKQVYDATICSDVRSYNACLTFAMQATGCGEHLPTLREIIREQQHRFGLGFCTAGNPCNRPVVLLLLFLTVIVLLHKSRHLRL